MKFLKKLFGRKQEESTEWNVTPVTDLSISAKPISKGDAETPIAASGESAESNLSATEPNEQNHFESLPSAQEDMHEPLVQGGDTAESAAASDVTPSLIKPKAGEFLPAQASIAEMEINEVLEAIETGSEYEAQVIDKAENEWQETINKARSIFHAASFAETGLEIIDKSSLHSGRNR